MLFQLPFFFKSLFIFLKISLFIIKLFFLKMDKFTYCDMMEDADSKLFVRFNEKYKWFEKISRNKRLNSIDYVGVDVKGRKTHIELKQRKETLDKIKEYGDILIEPKKMSAYAAIMESGFTLDEQRLYINFTSDGYVLIWNMNDKLKINYYPNHRHWNPMKKEYENEDRFGLIIEQAIVKEL